LKKHSIYWDLIIYVIIHWLKPFGRTYLISPSLHEKRGGRGIWEGEQNIYRILAEYWVNLLIKSGFLIEYVSC